MADLPKIRTKSPEEIAHARQRSAAQQQVRDLAHAVCQSLNADRMKQILERVAEGDVEFINGASHPIDLHAFASNWNGDRGVLPLLQIAEHRSCDAGTALWLYWENDPYFYSRFSSVEDADDEDERVIVGMLRSIEERMGAKRFATSIIPFDPIPWVETRYDNATWAVHRIPDGMYRPIVAEMY